MVPIIENVLTLYPIVVIGKHFEQKSCYSLKSCKINKKGKCRYISSERLEIDFKGDIMGATLSIKVNGSKSNKFILQVNPPFIVSSLQSGNILFLMGHNFLPKCIKYNLNEKRTKQWVKLL